MSSPASLVTPLSVGEYVGVEGAMSALVNNGTTLPTDPTSLLQLILATLNQLNKLVSSATGLGANGGSIEQSFAIPRTIFTDTYDADRSQILTLTVPFAWNTLLICSVGGVVNFRSSGAPFNNSFIISGSPPYTFGTPNASNAAYEFAFGAVGFVGDNSTANTGTQIAMYSGPQEVRTNVRPSGQVSLWSAPVNRSPGSLNAMISPIELTGIVAYLP